MVLTGFGQDHGALFTWLRIRFTQERTGTAVCLQDVLQRSRYAGSGQAVKYNAQGEAVAPRNDQLIRHDYFTAPVISSDGQVHTVQIDVEVSKADNKYRTHHVIKSIELVDDTSAPGMTRNDRMSTTTSSMKPTIPPSGPGVKTASTGPIRRAIRAEAEGKLTGRQIEDILTDEDSVSVLTRAAGLDLASAGTTQAAAGGGRVGHRIERRPLPRKWKDTLTR